MKKSLGGWRKIVERFEKLGILKEITGLQRNRVYRYAPYLKLFERQGIKPD